MTAFDAPPESPSLPTAALARVFDNVTSSHKFLWMLAILDVLPFPRFRDCESPVVPMDLLVYRMLKVARETLEQFRLEQFIYHDRFHEYLELCRQRGGLFLDDNPPADLRDADGQIPRDVYRPLVGADSAPYRFLVPFLPREVNITAGIVRKMTAEMSRGDSPAPYCFSDSGKEIVIHARWAEYFSDNADIVRGWTLWSWTQFLETRGVNTPSLTAKISGIEQERRSLSTPCKLFDAAILHSPDKMRCIYSGAPLEPEKYSVDHYLPWKLVVHNRFWNLAPTFKDVNSSKSDTLPDKRYLDKLAGIHRVAIAAYHDRPDLHRECGGLMLSYFTDLQVNAHESPPDEGELVSAYRRAVSAYMAVAEIQGFKTGWQYRKTGAGNKRTQSSLVS